MENEMEAGKRELLLGNLNDAEMVLVGIGEEFGEKAGDFEKSAEYAAFLRKTNGAESFQWMVPFVEEIYVKNHKGDKTEDAYRVLEELLQGIFSSSSTDHSHH